MKAKKIIDFLEEKYPKSNAEEWDNVGLLVGNINKDIKKNSVIHRCYRKSYRICC